MVGSVVLHRAALLVRDGNHAVHVGIGVQQSRVTNLVRDVFAGAGRAIDRTDDGNVIAGAKAAVATVIAHEVARLGRFGWRRTVLAKGVVTLELVGRDVMDVNVGTGRDVRAGEADDLGVL